MCVSMNKRESSDIPSCSVGSLHLFCLKYLHLAGFPRVEKHRIRLSEDAN